MNSQVSFKDGHSLMLPVPEHLTHYYLRHFGGTVEIAGSLFSTVPLKIDGVETVQFYIPLFLCSHEKISISIDYCELI